MTSEQFVKWREALGGTRFFMAVSAGVVNTLLRIFDYIDQSIYAELTFGTVAVYITGHVYERVKTNASQPNQPVGPPVPDSGSVRGGSGRSQIGVGP